MCKTRSENSTAFFTKFIPVKVRTHCKDVCVNYTTIHENYMLGTSWNTLFCYCAVVPPVKSNLVFCSSKLHRLNKKNKILKTLPQFQETAPHLEAIKVDNSKQKPLASDNFSLSVPSIYIILSVKLRFIIESYITYRL